MAHTSTSVLFSFTILVFQCSGSNENIKNKVSLAEIQSCRGCTLNSLPEVRAFIFEDVPKYSNVVFKPIQGAIPELVIYGNLHQELERISLRDKSRKECNELLKEWGFTLKLNTKSNKDVDDEL